MLKCDRNKQQTSMPVIKRSDIIRTGNVEIPLDRYSARIKKCVAGESKRSGNPMLSWECEIVWDKLLEVNGEKYDINGIEFSIHQPYDDGDGQGKILDFNAKLGLPEELNTEAPNTVQYDGKLVDLILKSERQVKRKAPTDAQKKAGQPGDPIKDAAGKEVSLGFQVQAWLTDVLGLSMTQVKEPGGASVPSPVTAVAAGRPF